nr:neuron navigator 2-like [Ciona intestinalis]|eukprot:XP_002128416.1 neuron navigator 2-like [Ciona intestinalis]
MTNEAVADESLFKVVKWLPHCWQHINKCIETHSSADATLGPRMFSCCPMDTNTSYTWFHDLWNFTIVPYLISAVKQRKPSVATKWVDPLAWVKECWPWATPCDLLRIRAEDIASDATMPLVGGDNATTMTSQSTDPLLNMLLRLQEAATNYESDASHDDAFELSLDRALGDLA